MQVEIRFGKPDSYDYDTILDQFSGIKINTIRTSSIPLVQFWKDTDSRLKELFSKIPLSSGKQILCFEYPTKVGKGKGKSSMTDLMILCDNNKIAIEAKFTEYAKMKDELIGQWENKSDKENRKKVLNYWTDLIKPFSNGYESESIQQISYQFYHRTASACKDSENAIVIYQIFYDNETLKCLESYKNKLQDYAKILSPNDKLSFYIWEIEVVQKITDIEINDPFEKMKYQNIYEFKKTSLNKI
jgi:hypothetical protein